LKEKIGKNIKGKSIKVEERTQFLKWIVSCYESLPLYINKSDISDSHLQSRDRSTSDLLDDFSKLLASFINCGLTLVTTNEPEYGKYTLVPPLKEGISN
jgi:hypothetical protein